MKRKHRKAVAIPVLPLQAARSLGYGGVTRLCRVLDISREALYNWKQFPAEHVKMVSAVTGIPREKLRPDLWG